MNSDHKPADAAHEPAEDDPREPPDQKPGGIRWTAVAAWAVIIGVSIVTIAAQSLGEKASIATPNGDAAPEVREETLLIGKVVVGGSSLIPGYRSLFVAQVAALAEGTPVDQLCYAIALGELAGPDAALEALADFEAKQAQVEAQPIDQIRTLAAVLKDLYEDRAGGRPTLPSVSEEDAATLRASMGWYGKLALLHEQTPDQDSRVELLEPLPRILVALVVFGGWIVTFFLGGLAAIGVLIVLGAQRRLRRRFESRTDRGHIYAETFAIWMVLFSALQTAFAALSGGEPRISMGMMASLLSLGALIWPIIRGISFQTISRDIGLKIGLRLGAHLLIGILGYAIGLVMVALGFIGFVGLTALQKQISADAPPPSHPIVDFYTSATGGTIVMLFIFGAIVAPIVEEIMFRGVLYRHLRDATARWGLALSFLWSAGVSSLVFAAIHPQGWTFIPILGALALTFSFLREWRDSLVPSMVAHGMQNGVTMALGFSLFLGGA